VPALQGSTAADDPSADAARQGRRRRTAPLRPRRLHGLLRHRVRRRVGLWELLNVNDELRDVILKTPTIGEIRKAVEAPSSPHCATSATTWSSKARPASKKSTAWWGRIRTEEPQNRRNPSGIAGTAEFMRREAFQRLHRGPVRLPAVCLTIGVMSKQRIVSGQPQDEAEQRFNQSLRPTRIEDYVGQPRLVEKLRIALTAAAQRGEPMEHVLLHGPPGWARRRWRTSSPRN